jgi:hypothetical protein
MTFMPHCPGLSKNGGHYRHSRWPPGIFSIPNLWKPLIAARQFLPRIRAQDQKHIKG